MPFDDHAGPPISASETNDLLWEYDGLHAACQEEREEILLEMQRIFYDDLRLDQTRGGDLWVSLMKSS